VSQWTWAATLLQSSNVAWQYGITGPFWYAAGATIQILLFGILAIDVKIRAPNAHTFLEMIYVRWGACAHLTFMFFGFSANLIVSAMLLLGGCAVFNAVAGIPIAVSSFLIPLLTLFYTLIGGLKATFLASYFHTALIFIILILMVTTVYGIEIDCTDTTVQCNSLGSAGLVWERLLFLVNMPVRQTDFMNITLADGTLELRRGFHQGPILATPDGNRQGSYLTIMSRPGLQFGIINIIGNFGTVFVDQSYWQSAIAAKPAAAHKGYILGGMVWFTIPFALATSLGLAGNALNVGITAGDAGNGLVPPAAAIAMLGPAGGILIIIQLTMAILSTGSAECIAVSSLIAYDVYRCYINKAATGKQILCVSRVMIGVWALIMALSSIVLNAMNIGLGWVYCFMGIWIGSAVCPVACCIYTDKLGKVGAIASAWIGLLAALIAWFAMAAAEVGEISKDSLGNLNAQTVGGLTALVASFLICAIACCVAPSNFDWKIMIEGIELVGGDGGENAKVLGEDWESDPAFLKSAKDWIFKWAWAISIFMCVIWPLAAVPFGVMGKSTFQLWGMIAVLWGWTCGLTIVILPILESYTWFASAVTGGKATSTKEPAAEVATA